MEWIMEHWLSVGAGIFLLSMILYGHYRGFLRIAVTMSALVISIVVVQLAAPKMTSFLKQNAAVRNVTRQLLLKSSGLQTEEYQAGEASLPSHERLMIEQLQLPRQMKEALLENNNHEIYQMLGVDSFIEYVGQYLADMVLNLIGSLILFLLVYCALRILMHWLDLIARLPILSGMNQIAGAILGGFRGLLWIWIGFLITDLFAAAPWAAIVMEQIERSMWLTFLYQNNFFNWMLAGVLRWLI